MKAFLLISFILLACTTVIRADANSDLDAFSRACMGEAKVTEKEVEEFYSTDAKFNTGSPNLQCHLKCVMEKLGELKGGVLNVDRAIKVWKEIPELAEHGNIDPKVFNNCKNEKGANDCETAFKITKCIRQNKTR